MAGAFLYENLIESAASVTVNDVLGGLSAQTPVSNLLDPQPRLRVRVALAPARVQVLVDLGAVKELDCVAFISSTATAAATAQVRLSTADPSGVLAEGWGTGIFPAETGPEANGNVVITRGFTATGRYLLVDLIDGTQDSLDLGYLAVGKLWRLSRAQNYGFREGRLMLDQRDRNQLTGAEFPVPALFNPRFAAFQVVNLRTAEIQAQQRDMLRRLGAVGDALWIPDLGLTQVEMNRRSIWGAAAQPGDDAGAERANFVGWSQAWRLIERG